MTDRGWRGLDGDLRRALQSTSATTPMPVDLLDVPDAWVGQRPGLLRRLRRPTAFAAVAVAAVLLATQLGQFAANRADGMSLQTAAAVLGLPARQVLQTADGFVAIRMNPSRVGRIELLHADAQGRSTIVIATAQLDPARLGKDTVSMSAFGVSCRPDAGLTQPDFVFGYVHYASVFPDQVAVDAPSTGTWNQGLFVFALDPDVPPGWLAIDTHSSARPDLDAKAQFAPEAFDHRDAC